MSWHGAAPKGAGRFDLLLLEEGEYFFEDYSAVRAELPKFHAFSPSPGALANLRQVRGRIKVCSRGIMFDPEDSTVPVACYTFKAMRARCPQAFARERRSGTGCAARTAARVPRGRREPAHSYECQS